MTSQANPTSILKVSDAPAKYVPTDAESDLVGEVTEWVKTAERHRERFVRIWELVRNYIRGEQNLYVSESGEFVRLEQTDQNRRLVSINNQMKLAVRQLVAKITKYIPTFRVAAQNADQDQIQAAAAASALHEFLVEKNDFEVKYLAAVLDIAEVGIGYLAVSWDPDAGRKLAICPVCNYLEPDEENVDKPCPACIIENELTQPEIPHIGQLVEEREGDTTLEYINSREFLPDPGCFEIEHMRKYAIRRPQPVSELRARYPEFADVIEPKRGLYNYNNVKVIRSTRQGQYSYDEFQEHAIETVYYEAASIMHPRGRRIVTINDDILVVPGEDNPHWFLGRPNVFAFHWDKENDTFYSQPWGQHAWHRQKELNENETQQRENAEILANGKVLIPHNSGIRPDELTARTGQTVRYNPAMPPPQPLRMPELPQSVYARGGIVKGSIFEQASIGLAEQGMVNGDVAGRALAIMQAEADQQIGPMQKRLWAELGELFKAQIEITRRHYSADRQYYVNGEDGLRVYSLQDMELLQGYDLRMEIDDGLSKNQQLRFQSLAQLVQLGAFSNPQTGMLDFPKFAKAAKINIPGVGVDKNSAQRTHAHFMLRQIEQGDFSQQPTPWDDPLACADVFHGWLTTKGYNPKIHPMIKQHVYGMFQFYTQMAMFAANPVAGQPPAPPQAPQMGPAGMGPGGQNAGQAQGIAQQAVSTVQQADRSAERQVMAQGFHEN